jgi:hypothetical protein
MITWIAKVSDRLEKLSQNSAIAVADEVRIPVQAGGHMPYVTGNLSRSLEASLNELPIGDLNPTAENLLPEPRELIRSVVSTAKIGDNIYLGFRAAYAPEMEQKYGFVRLTAQIWPQIVDLELAKLGP